MAGRGDDDDIFTKFFGSFFGRGMDDHFNELTRQMEEMFRDFGFTDANVSSEGLPRPPMAPGGKPPSLESPRDQMLKDPAGPANCGGPSCNADGQGTNAGRSPLGFSQFTRPDVESPFPRPNFGRTPGQQEPSNTIVSSWTTTTTSSATNTGSGWNKTEVRTVRHPDGTTERIEKNTQDGRTCTTTTKTDPHGVTTTNTTCDRPAIDSPPLKDSSPPTDSPALEPSGSRRGLFNVRPAQPSDPGSNTGAPGFFSRIFGFTGFKPKD